MKKYTNIPLPEELVRQIDKIINAIDLGYKTKTEFVKEAVREKIIKLNEYFQSFNNKR